VSKPSVSMMVSSSKGISAGRAGSNANDDHVRTVFRGCAGPLNIDPMRVDEAGFPIDQIDAVARHLILHDFNLILDDVVGAKGEIFDRNRLFQAIFGPIQGALAKSCEIKNRFAEGFAGDGAGIGTDAANDFFALDDADFFAQLGRLNRSLLAGRPGPYDKKIVMGHEIYCLY